MSRLGLSVRGLLLFGHLPLRMLLMLAMLGVVGAKGAPVSLPTSATAQFKRFFDCGRAVSVFASVGFWSFHAFGCPVWLSRCCY